MKTPALKRYETPEEKLAALQSRYKRWRENALIQGNPDRPYALLADEFISGFHRFVLPEVDGLDTLGLIAINKPSGLSFGFSLRAGSVMRPGFQELVILGSGNMLSNIHQIDEFTSGVVLFSERRQARAHVSTSLSTREGVTKTYFALVKGKFTQEETIVNAKLDVRDTSHVRVNEQIGLPAETALQLVATYQDKLGKWYSLLQVTPHSGRTHQIRVHTSHIGHPIVGDFVYADSTLPKGRYFLHASEYTVPSPYGERRGNLLTFRAPLADDFAQRLDSLRVIDIIQPKLYRQRIGK